MSDTPPAHLSPEERERWPNRWDCPGIICIGDVVLWDGEAEYFGWPPRTRWPPRKDRTDDQAR